MSSASSKKRIAFIVNPIAGAKNKSTLDDSIRQYLDLSKFDFEVIKTKFQGHATQLSEELVKKDIDVVVAVGGDGSINEISRALKGTNKTLGIIPFGTGNGLAHHLHIPFRTSRAIEVINQYKIHTIDTLDINGRLCVSIAGVGFDALIAKEFEKSKSRGFHTYFKIILKEYVKYKPQKYVIKVDGKTYRDRALFVSFANSNQFGFNATISPNARVDDGLIDVCIIKKIPIPQVIFLANLMFLKQIDKTPFIKIIQGKEVYLSRRKDRLVNIDGEKMETEKKLNVTIQPQSLKVIVP